MAFFSFSFAASSIYVLNDLVGMRGAKDAPVGQCVLEDAQVKVTAVDGIAVEKYAQHVHDPAG